MELKHIIDAYKYQDDIYGSSDLWKIVKLSDTMITLYNGLHYNEINVDDFKLYYRICKFPLSDLTEEIEVNGESFVPIDELLKNVECQAEFDFIRVIEENITEAYSKMIFCPYSIMQKLFEWHFDGFGGIGTWAIDINTLQNV